MLNKKAKGFTLVELIMAIVIISVGLAGILMVYTTTVKSSSDPMLMKQMTAIAEGVMEEILLKPYTVSANIAPAACARDTYNDVLDFHGYSCANATDISGVTTVAGYAVAITVVPTVAVPFNGLLAANDALLITITVTKGSTVYTLNGWRTNYAG